MPQGYYNMFHHETAINAERLLLKTVVGMLKDHKAIWMWNLANEPDLFAWPLTSDEGAAWVKQMVDLIKEIDPNHPVTIGSACRWIAPRQWPTDRQGLQAHRCRRDAFLSHVHALGT